jgi:hypothetical protein
MLDRQALYHQIGRRIFDGAQRRKGYPNVNYQAFANILWYQVAAENPDIRNDAVLRKYVDNPKIIKNKAELSALENLITGGAPDYNGGYISALVDWAIENPAPQKQLQDPFTDEQMLEHRIDNIYVALHNSFVDEVLLLSDIRKVKIQAGQVFYRGIASTDELDRQMEGGELWHMSHMPIVDRNGVKTKRWFECKIRSPWLETERNSIIVATSKDLSVGFRYARGEGWVSLNKPPQDAEAVSLAHYRSRGSAFREIDFSNIPSEWTQENVHIKPHPRGGICVDKIATNPYYISPYHPEPDQAPVVGSGEWVLHELFNNYDINNPEQSYRLVETTPKLQKFKNNILRVKNRYNIGGLQYFRYDMLDNNDNVVGTYDFSHEDSIFKDFFRKTQETSKKNPKYKDRKDFEKRYTSQQIAALRRHGAPIVVPDDPPAPNPNPVNINVPHVPGGANFIPRGSYLPRRHGYSDSIGDMIGDLTGKIDRNRNDFKQQSDLIDRIQVRARRENLQYVNPEGERYDYINESGTRVITWMHPKAIVNGELDINSPFAAEKYQIVYKITKAGKVTIEKGEMARAKVLVKPDASKSISAAIVGIEPDKQPDVIQTAKRRNSSRYSISCRQSDGFAAAYLASKNNSQIAVGD